MFCVSYRGVCQRVGSIYRRKYRQSGTFTRYGTGHVGRHMYAMACQYIQRMLQITYRLDAFMRQCRAKLRRHRRKLPLRRRSLGYHFRTFGSMFHLYTCSPRCVRKLVPLSSVMMRPKSSKYPGVS